ncbi:MAG: hypothetical protein NTY03_05295 [Candidatus Bathyarchaeota archaeon]|nr:hypothetical protein [Candidatus Bathyarchaeota archaeon]
MNNDLEKSPLWGVLVETVHSLPLYKSHKAYIKEIIIPLKPDASPEELSERIGMPLGEAIVILYELGREKPVDKKD